MKNKERLLTVLNKILVDELNTANKNITHYRNDEPLDFGKVYETISSEIETEAAEKLKQAEWLIKRIIFLEVWRSHNSSISLEQNNSEKKYETRSKAG
jgi:bacterioferritin (cytochrome b1)